MAIDPDLTLLYKFSTDNSLVAHLGLGPTLALTRASANGTYFDSSGVMQTAAANEARFDHDPSTGHSLGLLFEDAGTNIQFRSGELDHVDWDRTLSASLTTGVADIAGTSKAVILVENGAGGAHRWTTLDASYTSGLVYTETWYVKAGTRDWVRFAFPTTAFPTDAHVHFNVSTVTVGTIGAGADSASIENAGDGWVRISLTATCDSTTTSFGFINLADADGSISYSGINLDESMTFCFPQIEQHAFATSYVESGVGSATRTADAINSTDVTWFNSVAGTLFVSARDRASGDLIGIQSADTTPSYSLYHTAAQSVGRIQNSGGLIALTPINASWNIDNTQNHIALGYADNDFQMYCNGIASAHDIVGVQSGVVTQFNIGVTNITGVQFSGRIQEIRYYNVRKNDAFLESSSNGLIQEKLPPMDAGRGLIRGHISGLISA